jgi:radical S-adenosyl methionine domain-containing protein 2
MTYSTFSKDDYSVQLPSTVNLHFIRSCNGMCRYCFAGFDACGSGRLLTKDLERLIDLIAAVPLPAGSRVRSRKVNFVGGEPTLAADLPHVVRYAKEAGLVTSIVTNGYRLVKSGLAAYEGALDLLGVSIDSLTPGVNRKIGRVFCGQVIEEGQWRWLADDALRRGIALKVNTVVNRFNVADDISWFIRSVSPIRWKVFQAMPVEGENHRDWSSLAVSRLEFQTYLKRHQSVADSGIALVAEDHEVMRGSYAMISPDGRFFDTVAGRNHYSEPILKAGVSMAFAQVHFSAEKYARREGDYLLPVHQEC